VSNWFRTYGFADLGDGLFVGAYPLDADDVATLGSLGIGRILNLVEDDEYRPGERDAVATAIGNAGIEEYRLGLTDYGGLPAPALEAAVQEVSHWLAEGKRTYVHCRAGWQRSAAIAAGVVAARRGLYIDAALEYVQAHKPSADPLPHQREDLRIWWQLRGPSQPSEASGDRAPSPPPADAAR
jgi:protein-tyrosine phosphatase